MEQAATATAITCKLCPDNPTFKTKAGLGSHRRASHGIEGSSPKVKSSNEKRVNASKQSAATRWQKDPDKARKQIIAAAKASAEVRRGKKLSRSESGRLGGLARAANEIKGRKPLWMKELESPSNLTLGRFASPRTHLKPSVTLEEAIATLEARVVVTQQIINELKELNA